MLFIPQPVIAAFWLPENTVLIHEDFASSPDSYLKEAFISFSATSLHNLPKMYKSTLFQSLISLGPPNPGTLDSLPIISQKIQIKKLVGTQFLLEIEKLSKHHLKLLILRKTH